MPMRILQAWRARFRGKVAVQGIAATPEGDVVFETWAGGWVERGRAGLAIAGILRDAGLNEDHIRLILTQALESLDRNEDAT